MVSHPRTPPRSRPSAPLSPARVLRPSGLHAGRLSGAASWTGTSPPASPPRGRARGAALWPLNSCPLPFVLLRRLHWQTRSPDRPPPKPAGASRQRGLRPLPPGSRELPAAPPLAVPPRAPFPQLSPGPVSLLTRRPARTRASAVRPVPLPAAPAWRSAESAFSCIHASRASLPAADGSARAAPPLVPAACHLRALPAAPGLPAEGGRGPCRPRARWSPACQAVT